MYVHTTPSQLPILFSKIQWVQAIQRTKNYILTCMGSILQKKLEDTEYALDDLEEKYSQLSCTLKEKEFIISSMLQSG